MLARTLLLLVLALPACTGFMAPATPMRRSLSWRSAVTRAGPGRLPLRAAGRRVPFGATMMAGGTATLARPEILQEAVRNFLGEDCKAKCTPTDGGVNNWVQYVDTEAGERFVLRVYNNGCNTPRVEYEHEILAKLASEKLSFQLPVYMQSKTSGKTHVALSNGAEACMSQLIPGTLPKSAKPQAIGLAAGELLSALGTVKMTRKSPTPPYYEIYDVHHAISKDKFLNEVKKDTFDGCRAGMDTLLEEFVRMEEFIEEHSKSNDLPMQLIHGDLHFDNVLFDGDKVTGLLDFEFAAEDWRGMELAVCLSKYAAEDDPLSLIDSFSSGFAVKGKMTRKEVECIPEMINLRIMSNVLYFVGRALAGEDTIDALTSRADMYADRVVWVRQNRDKIVACIDKHMRANGAY